MSRPSHLRANEALQEASDIRPSMKKDMLKREYAPGACTNPALAAGQMRPCRQCTACAYGQAMKKVTLLKSELDPIRPSYFVTLTYDDEHRESLLTLPAKPAGDLTPAQELQAKKWRSAIHRLKGRLKDVPETSTEAMNVRASIERRIVYRTNKLEAFLEECLKPRPRRPSIRRQEGKLWKKRFLELLQGTNPAAKLPRMVIKHEYGSRTIREHIHVLMLHPSPQEISCAIAAWGWLRLTPTQSKAVRLLRQYPFPGAHLLLKPSGRGHVNILEVGDEGVATYVTKDLYRGQEFEAFAYIAKGVEPPCISWPRDPGIGCGGWLTSLREKWAWWKDTYKATPEELELILQDSRNFRFSIRHRLINYKPAGTKLPSGQPRENAKATYQACPPAPWRQFLEEIRHERGLMDPHKYEGDPRPTPEDTDRRRVVYLVRERLAEVNRSVESGAPFIAQQRHHALRSAEIRLDRWRSICNRKGIPLPDYAQREREYIARKQRELQDAQRL